MYLDILSRIEVWQGGDWFWSRSSFLVPNRQPRAKISNRSWLVGVWESRGMGVMAAFGLHKTRREKSLQYPEVFKNANNLVHWNIQLKVVCFTSIPMAG